MNLWIVLVIVLAVFAVNEARKGDMRAVPYAAVVAVAVVGVIIGIWLVLEWASPE